MSLIKLTLWQGGQPLYVLPSEVVTIAPCWRDHDAALVDLRSGKFHKVLGTSEETHTKVFGPAMPSADAALLKSLLGILSQHCGETQENEGAVDTLMRLVREAKAA